MSLSFVDVAVHATGYAHGGNYLNQHDYRRDVAVRLERYINVPEMI